MGVWDCGGEQPWHMAGTVPCDLFGSVPIASHVQNDQPTQIQGRTNFIIMATLYGTVDYTNDHVTAQILNSS